MHKYNLTHLQQLENEAIFIMREVASQFERPVMLFSGGKDSIVMVRLAQKAFWPAKIPFPLMHIDTGHNFSETIEFRDNLVKDTGAELIVASVQESIDKGLSVEEKGPNASRNAIQTITLLDAIEQNKFDAAFGGGRRDEEKASAKERFFSHRDEFGQWDPKNQSPNSGTSSMARNTSVSISGFSHLATGPKWTFGNISPLKTSTSQTYILPTSAMW